MKKGILLLLMFASVFYASAQTSGKYQIKFLEINKQNSDYGVAILDDNKLVFTSAYEKAKSKRSYNPRKDLYVGDISSDGEITNIKPIVKNKDSKFNQTGATYSSDGKTVYFSKSLYNNKRRKQKLPKNKRLDMYKASVKADGSWTAAEKLPFNADHYSTGYPVLNQKNTKLYFVSDRLPSSGGTDIFVVNISKDGTYGKPRNLGKHVNTPGNETTPFITEDNILYFSSDGHPGKGKLDVFAVEVFESSTSDVMQLASPINSINDDFAYIINKEKNLGFFTSNRLQGKDSNDLYGFTLEKELIVEDCYIAVEGKVKDVDTKNPISGANVELFDLNGSLLESISTYNDGSYKFKVSCAKEYKIVASNANYLTDEKHIEILEENYHSTLHTNLNLNKVVVKKAVVETLQPIYYDFDDASITESAAREMDKIVKIMNDNQELTLEASAFTDSRGSNDYNRKLSEKRAKSAIEYIVSKGIDKTRVKGRGYGEEKLVNQCVNGVNCDEHDHQINRRTEFNFTHIQSHSYVPKTTRSTEYIPVSRRKSFNKTLKSNSNIKKEPGAKIAKTSTPIKEEKKIPKPKEKSELIKKADVKTVNVEKQKETPKKELSVVAVTNTVKKEEASEVIQKESKQVVYNNDNSDSKEEESIAMAEENKQKSSKPKSTNIAENYIDDEKNNIVNQLLVLEKKYDKLIAEKSDKFETAKAQKQKVSEFKKAVQELEQTGWSNIINYKIELKRLKRSYKSLTGPTNSSGAITVIESETKKIPTEEKKEVEKPIAKIDNKNHEVKFVDVAAIKVNSDGIYSKTNNAKEAELIKVSFKVKRNNDILKGNKDAHLVINTPNGRVTDATGVFKPKNSEVDRKFSNHIVYDNSESNVKVIMYVERKGDHYSEGIYPIELFLEGELVAVSNLNLGPNDLALTAK